MFVIFLKTSSQNEKKTIYLNYIRTSEQCQREHLDETKTNLYISI